ncbi:MAG: hypothetical protein JW891_03785 [Candidatus Lokiarchaeota archaeon]|nr:hypothetical protein [Candidatus Lokiarchaeota archaeon]
MVKVIQDLWILTENGVAVFSRIQDEKLNDQLFAMLMSALNSFAEEIASGGLSNFELSNKRFSLAKKNKFIFVVSSSPKIKEKKVYEELEIVIDKFFEKFSKDLKEWNNDVSIFNGFETYIDDSLENTIKKFQKAFW